MFNEVHGIDFNWSICHWTWAQEVGQETKRPEAKLKEAAVCLVPLIHQVNGICVYDVVFWIYTMCASPYSVVFYPALQTVYKVVCPVDEDSVRKF